MRRNLSWESGRGRREEADRWFMVRDRICCVKCKRKTRERLWCISWSALHFSKITSDAAMLDSSLALNTVLKVVHTLCIRTFVTTCKEHITISINKREDWGQKNLSNLSVITQLINGRADSNSSLTFLHFLFLNTKHDLRRELSIGKSNILL